ncbi:hypothetical protein [uncultured Cohaesibacter sp.]|uniref:hypothetical protein n=1 Tax=uncultured Cohaesibacter sp. TaxID=1002546 RepID=UPI0029C9B1D9|nr:hypothetical protein [uncultured Cohaesibacter sp.]
MAAVVLKILSLLVKLAPMLASLLIRRYEAEQVAKRTSYGKENSWEADANKVLEQLMSAKWGETDRQVQNDPVEKELDDSHPDVGSDRLRCSDGFKRD